MSLDGILFNSIITIIVLKPTLNVPKNGYFRFENGAIKQQIGDKIAKEIKLAQIAD